METTTLFVVRVWHDGAFRASVRRVADEDTRFFASAGALVVYLETASDLHDISPAQIDPAPSRITATRERD